MHRKATPGLGAMPALFLTIPQSLRVRARVIE